MIKWLEMFWNWVDYRRVVRRGVLVATVVLTFQSYYWAAEFASETMCGAMSLDIAAAIAAVTGPVSALQGFAFKWYAESRA